MKVLGYFAKPKGGRKQNACGNTVIGDCTKGKVIPLQARCGPEGG